MTFKEVEEKSTELIEKLTDKIIPLMRNQNNTETNIKLFAAYELTKFYFVAYATGQQDILDFQEKNNESI
jgi:hypothetical protein